MTLTPAQDRAILTLDRDVGILASAGSGKTTVLCAHYRELLVRGRQSPKRILVFTFTEKAAGEVKERIERSLQDSDIWHEIAQHFWSESWISTIHHFCARVCRQNAHLLGFSPNFTILENEISLARYHTLLREKMHRDLSERDEAARRLVGEYGFERFEALMLELHDKHIAPELLRAHPLGDALTAFYHDAEARFRKEKRDLNSLDFDDLETLAIEIFERFPAICDRYQSLFTHILVDEFQDLNNTQGRLIDLLWKPGGNHLFFVGDPKQSIYGFRGANVDIFHHFWQRLPQTGGEQLILAENWRSAAPLIDFANALFEPLFNASASTPIPYSPMISTQLETPGVVVHHTLTSDAAADRRSEEANYILSEMKALADSGMPWRDMAVICRSGLFFSHLIPLLENAEIPYDTQKSALLAHEPFVLFLETLFTYLINPDDTVARLGVLYSDTVGLPIGTLAQIRSGKPETIKNWQRFEDILIETLNKTALFSTLTPSERMEQFRHLYEEAYGLSLFKTSYDSFLYFRFLHYLIDEEKKGGKTPKGWQRWLASLESHSPRSPSKPTGEHHNKVQLLTIHAAKGLEFDAVFLADLAGRGKSQSDFFSVDPSFGDSSQANKIGWQELEASQGFSRKLTPNPDFDRIKEKQKSLDYEESKRLLYVAATRAKRILFIQTPPLSENKLKKTKSLSQLSAWSDWIRFSIEKGPLGDFLQSIPLQDRLSFVPSALPTMEIALPPLEMTPIPKRARFAPKPAPVTTVTALETYSRCGWAYYLTYCDVQSRAQANYRQQDWTASRIGSAVHDYLAKEAAWDAEKFQHHLFGFCRNETLLPPEPSLIRVMEREIQSVFSHPIYEAITNATSRYHELPFMMSLDGIAIRGCVDLVYDGTLIDFKTHRTQEKDIPFLTHYYAMQMQLYAEACHRMFKRSLDTALLFFTHTRTLSPVPILDSLSLTDRVRHIVDSIGRDDFSKTSEKETCYHCPFYKKECAGI